MDVMRTFFPAGIRRWCIGFTVVLVVAFAASPATATNFRTYGFGARAVAMGGAMTGHVDDFTASFYNPAGLVAKPGFDFSFGVQYTSIDVSARNPAPVPAGSVRSSNAFPIDDAVGFYGGMKIIIPFADALKDRIGFGLSFFQGMPNAIDVEVPYGFVPQYVLLNGQTNLLVIQPALAVRVLDGFRVGVGAVIFSDVGGNLEIPTGIRGYEGVDDARTVIDQEMQPVVRAILGVQVDGQLLSERLSRFQMGFTWRDSFNLPLRIPIAVLLGPIPLNIDLSSDLLWTPMQAAMGLAYKTERLTLAYDISWNQWSEYSPPTLELALDIVIPVVPIDLKDAVNGPPRTRDTYTHRIGAEWRLLDGDKRTFWLRSGYAYEPTPFREQTGATNYLDDNRHICSAGFGVDVREMPFLGRLKKELYFDVGFQYNVIESSRHRKARINPLFDTDENEFGFPPLEDADGNPIADPAYPWIEGDAHGFLVLFTAGTTFGGGDR